MNQVYIEDAVSDRLWVDLPPCLKFADNICTIFQTRLPAGGTTGGAAPTPPTMAGEGSAGGKPLADQESMEGEEAKAEQGLELCMEDIDVEPRCVPCLLPSHLPSLLPCLLPCLLPSLLPCLLPSYLKLYLLSHLGLWEHHYGVTWGYGSTNGSLGVMGTPLWSHLGLWEHHYGVTWGYGSTIMESLGVMRTPLWGPLGLCEHHYGVNWG